MGTCFRVGQAASDSKPHISKGGQPFCLRCQASDRRASFQLGGLGFTHGRVSPPHSQVKFLVFNALVSKSGVRPWGRLLDGQGNTASPGYRAAVAVVHPDVIFADRKVLRQGRQDGCISPPSLCPAPFDVHPDHVGRLLPNPRRFHPERNSSR